MNTVAVTLTISLTLGLGVAVAQTPTYPLGTGPSVLFDTAHHNVGDNGVSIAKWLQADGYVTRELTRPFDRESLDGVQIAVICNALAAQNALGSARPTNQVWRLPTLSAFSSEEISVLHEWVLRGGALLLVFDHMPMPGAAEQLAAAFGVEVSNGFAVDARLLRSLDADTVTRAGQVMFSRADHMLADDPVTNGRGSAERVDVVVSYAGSAFRVPAGARSLLTLGPLFVSLRATVAWEFSESTPRQAVGGWSQGAILRAGRGRLAVLSDAQIFGSPDGFASLLKFMEERGERPAQAGENPRLLLNLFHWLSGLLDGGSGG